MPPSPLQVDREREKYSKVSESLVGAEVQFKMNDKWALSADAACYQARAIPKPRAPPRNSAPFCATR